MCRHYHFLFFFFFGLLITPTQRKKENSCQNWSIRVFVQHFTHSRFSQVKYVPEFQQKKRRKNHYQQQEKNAIDIRHTYV